MQRSESAILWLFEQFFYVLKKSDSFEIVNSKDIITKCVLIEKNNVFILVLV